MLDGFIVNSNSTKNILNSLTKTPVKLIYNGISIQHNQFEDLSNKKNTFNKRIHINKLKTGKLMSYCTESVGIAAKLSNKKINLLKKI